MNGQHWIVGANDNDWVGWGITVGYFGTAVLCFICGCRKRAVTCNSTPRECLLWWCVGTSVLLLGINKQLDLQTALRDVGRVMAETEGWYRHRRIVQVWFVVATAIVVLTALTLAGSGVRGAWRQYALLYAGGVILGGFVFLRAATFNHLGESLKWPSPFHHARFVLEASGIACICRSALKAIRGTGTLKAHPPV